MEKPENVPEAPLDLSKFVPISHDMFFREMFSDPEFAQAFLRKILKSEAVELLNLEMLEVLPTTFLTREFRELRADVIYRVPLKNGERAIHFYTLLEHKAQNDHWTIFQMTLYVAEIERKIVEAAEDDGKLTKEFLIPIVVPMIIYHGETPFTGPVSSVDLREKFVGYEEFCLCLKAILNDLSGIPDEDLPDDPNVPELNMAMRMMKYIMHKDFKKKFLEILMRLQRYYSNPKYQRFRQLIWHYAYGRAQYFTKEDADDVIKQLPNPEKEREEMSLMEQLKAEGRVEGRVESILLLLSSMGHVPQELVERVQEVDTFRLDNLLILAKKCDSIEEFEKAMSINPEE